MKKCLIGLLFVLNMPVVAAAQASLLEIIEEQRQHGFKTPALAAEQLTAARAEAGPNAPLEIRLKYFAALSSLHIAGENAPQVEETLQQLERMAKAENCVPCGVYHQVRQLQWAVRRQDLELARKLLEKVEALPLPTDRDLLQQLIYVRGSAYNNFGNHDRGVADGMRAVELAQASGNLAEQTRSLNLMVLANAGRRDLARAEALAQEAYNLAEQIGFTFNMMYLRGNQGWIQALKGEPQKQLVFLTDALRLARSQPGLSDGELVCLVNLATYYLTQKRHKESVETARQAIVLADRQSKPMAKGVTLAALGEAQIALGDSVKGVENLEAAVAILTKIGAKGYLVDALDTLSTAYDNHGRPKEALSALRKVLALQAEATTKEREKVISEAQEKFSTARKDHEIERLSLESGRRQAEVTARTLQQRLWAVVAIAFALGAALLVLMIKRARAKNRQLEVSNAALTDQSVHDPLTGAFNRRHCFALMGQQEALLANQSRDRQYEACVGMMLLDVDHFKHINDGFGHSAGDAVLIEMSRRLQDLLRQQDVVVRWGGEEFVLVLPGTAPVGMLVLAERVLQAIGSVPVMVDGKAIPVTVSIGCVAFPMFPTQHWEETLKIADFAMYMAKQRGRNRAICLMGLATDAQLDLVRSDLAAADQAGQVDLRTVEGPKAAVVAA